MTQTLTSSHSAAALCDHPFVRMCDAFAPAAVFATRFASDEAADADFTARRPGSVAMLACVAPVGLEQLRRAHAGATLFVTLLEC